MLNRFSLRQIPLHLGQLRHRKFALRKRRRILRIQTCLDCQLLREMIRVMRRSSLLEQRACSLLVAVVVMEESVMEQVRPQLSLVSAVVERRLDMSLINLVRWELLVEWIRRKMRSSGASANFPTIRRYASHSLMRTFRPSILMVVSSNAERVSFQKLKSGFEMSHKVEGQIPCLRFSFYSVDENVQMSCFL